MGARHRLAPISRLALCAHYAYSMRMKVNLYRRSADNDIWTWAQSRAERDRISLSRLIADALRSLKQSEEKGGRGRK